VVASVAVRIRRPVLPALTAALAGALVAGAATVLTSPPAQSSADQPDLNVARSGEQRPDGDLGQQSTTSSSGTSSTSATATTTIPPTTTTTTQTITPPAPPPVTSSTAPPAAPPTSTDVSAQDQVVTLVNDERGKAGCGPLAVNAQLTAAAQGHASDMAARGYFEHTTPEGVTFDQRIRNAGYSKPGAENIAQGAQTAASVMDLWMNSAGHRANILNCDLNTIGVGLDRDGFYWVQDFGF
jgi:uncharacterized protein YkwD